MTFAGSLPDGTKVAVKVLDPASAPPGSALAGLLLGATGGGEGLEEEEASPPSSRGVLDRPLAVGPTSRAIVTRLAEGGSLDGRLRGAPVPAAAGSSASASPLPPPRLSWAERLDLLSQVSGVLSRLHSQGLAHGSLSATNVLLDPVAGKGEKEHRRRWRARVSDAGVASLMATADGNAPPPRLQRTSQRWERWCSRLSAAPRDRGSRRPWRGWWRGKGGALRVWPRRD